MAPRPAATHHRDRRKPICRSFAMWRHIAAGEK